MLLSQIMKESEKVKQLENEVVIVVRHFDIHGGLGLDLQPKINLGTVVENTESPRYRVLLQDIATGKAEFLSDRDSIIVLEDQSGRSIIKAITEYLQFKLKFYVPDQFLNFETGKHSVVMFEDNMIKCIVPTALNESNFVLCDSEGNLNVGSFYKYNICRSLENVNTFTFNFVTEHGKLLSIMK